MSAAPKSFSNLALRLCALAGILAVFAFVGSYLNIEWLVAVIPGRPHMKLGAALCVLVAALASALQQGAQVRRARRVASRVLGVALALYACAAGAEFAFDVALGIDLPPPASGGLDAHPTLPSPFTAAACVTLGAALALFDVRRPVVSLAREGLCFVTGLIAFIGLIGHAFGAGPLYQFGGSPVVGIALSTAVALCALAVATWVAQPESLLLLVGSSGPGGILLRRLGLAGIVAGPVGAGLLLWIVRASGLSDLALVFAIGSALGVVFALSLLIATAFPLERSAQLEAASRLSAQELFEQAPEGIFIADLAGRYTDVNTAGCRLLGYMRDELLGKTILDLIPESDVPRLWRARERLLHGAADVDEWKLRRKDGAFVTVEVSAKILQDGRWQGFVRDISERRELEQKLIESRDFLQRVLESSTAYGIVAEDLERRVVLWNEGARRAYGYDFEEAFGRSSDMLAAPSQRDVWEELHARGLQEGSAEGNIVARRKDGSTFAAHVVCTRRHGPDDSAVGVLLVTRDLTLEQRYLAEQEFLSRVGVELASCLEYRETLACVARVGTSYLGDLVSIDVVKDGSFQREWVEERVLGSELASSVARLGSARAPGHPLWTVIETREPLLLPHIDRPLREGCATSDEHAEVLERVGATSAMLVPLIARGQLLAVLSIATRDPSRSYGDADLRLATELARRAALTIDNVQLFQKSRLQGAVTTNLAEGAALLRAADGVIVYTNPRFAQMFGYTQPELLNKRIVELDASLRLAAAQLESGAHWHGELQCARSDGAGFWCSVSVSNFDHEQHGRVWIALCTDITERKRLEQRTAQALQEKEVLLKEIHHRVKNNLQVISSLFSLQRDRSDNLELKNLLNESQARVASIALVHEQLYRSADLAAIDFQDYLVNLVSALRSSYGAERVSAEVDARGVLLDVDQAVPCALLVCELVTNSLKHAFGAATGKIWIRANRDARGICLLEIGDDGRGIPASFEWTKTRSLGLRLVQSLARQLRATITLDRLRGTQFSIRFGPWTSMHPAGPAN